MIQESTIKVLEQHFGKMTERINDDIIKCQKLFNEQAYQIFYVDLSNKWFKFNGDFNTLEKYIESILQKDYYSNPGFLQWNYYYLFISSEKEINKHVEQRNKIEKDEIYARKYVMTLERLTDWLKNLENIGKSISVEIKEDLSTIWINKLKQSKLDFIFMDIPYTNGVDSYLNGMPIIEPEEKKSDKNDLQKVDHIKKIRKIILTKYRDYPKEKEYEFGKVNLIEGSNASGKTSLLEAIELLLCGKTKRNHERDESGNEIEALINHGSKKINFTTNNSTLKNRDKFWYNKISAKTVSANIYERFNRYNFFNSDAAYQLTYGEQESIKIAFENISIGEQVNWLEDRLIKSKKRFDDNLRHFNRIISESKNELEEYQNTLKKITEIDDQPEKFLEGILSESKESNWIIPAKKKDSEIQFEKDITTAKYYIGMISSQMTWIDDLSLDKTQKEYNSLKQAEVNIIGIYEKLHNAESKCKTDKMEYNSLNEIYLLVNSAKKYYKEDKIDQINKLNEKIENVSFKLNNAKKIKELLDKIDLTLVLNVLNSITDYQKQTEEKIEITENELKAVNTEIFNKQESINLLDKIISEIRTKGRQYIQLKVDATECPLCHTIHPKGRLKQLIDEVREEYHGSEELKILLDRKNDLSNQLSELNKKKSIIINIIQACNIYYTDEVFSNKLFSEVLEEFKSIVASISGLENSLRELKSLQDYFKQKGLTEIEFHSLKSQLESKNIQIESNYDKVQKEFENNLLVVKNNIDLSNEIIEELKKEINKLLEQIGILDDSEQTLKKRIQNVDSALENYKELNSIISFEPKVPLAILERTVNKLSGLFERYKELKKKKEENEVLIKSSNSKIKELQERIKTNTPLIKNTQIACNTIDDILKNNSKSEFLKVFIDDNKNEISDIFKTIHSPKEFESVNIEAESLTIKKINLDDYVSLTEISAGQRAALALSIFLALNQKLKNGPDILLFDDPVLNIDDLNVLSFLDYLRATVIASERQIFFATANENLGYLFKKKFEFLNDQEFRKIQLGR